MLLDVRGDGRFDTVVEGKHAALTILTAGARPSRARSRSVDLSGGVFPPYWRGGEEPFVQVTKSGAVTREVRKEPPPPQ